MPLFDCRERVKPNTTIEKFPISAFNNLPAHALRRADGTPYDFFTLYKIQKVEEQKDGTLHVYGLVTAEEPDGSDEICDYGKTKPLYEKRCAEMAKITDIPGMEQSIMPLREMHGLNAVGKGTQVDFDDEGKAIRMGFDVVDPAAINKVKKGVLPCFSQGGNYAEKWADPKNKRFTRFAADPGEVSLVDRGCLPSAVIESIANKTFEYVGKNGSMQLRKFAFEPEPFTFSDKNLTKADLKEFAENFEKILGETIDQRLAKEKKTKRVGGKDLSSSEFAYVGDSEDTATWKLPIHDASHVRNALARLNQTELPEGAKAKVKAKIHAAAKKHGIEVADEAEKLMRAIQYMQAMVDGKPLEKGMYEVGYMAEVLDCLRWLQESATWEREFEGDASVQPEDFATLLQDAISCFVSMVEEETRELAEHAAALTATQGAEAMKNLTAAQLEKASTHMAAAASHLKKAKESHATMGGHVDNAMEACNKAMGEGGGEGTAGSKHGFDATGAGPTATDIRTGGEGGTGAHTAKSFDLVSIGHTAEGIEIFKKVEKKAEGENMNSEELIKAIGEQTQRQIDESLKGLITALVGSPDAIKAASGVGDRSLVLNPPARTEVITKAADADRNPGSGAKTEEVKPTTELYKKGLTGDAEARLQFARTIKKMPVEDTLRVQSNLASFARH